VTRPPRVLVVDDEDFITDVVSSALTFEGFAAEEATTVAEALARARASQFDCIVLDVMLPDGDGFEVCRRLRQEEIATPVLFLTARDESADKLTGLSLGDDYVTKPFSVEELVARIRAVLRRTGTAADDGRLRVADLVVDIGCRTVRRGGDPVDLTPTEFNLLAYLAANPRRVLSKVQILEKVWSEGFEGESNIVEIYISYLRKKIDCFPPPLIHTVRGVGYTMREPRP